MKVIIAGTRTFKNYKLLKEKCDYYFSRQKPDEIVSGCAKGADTLGEKYANENNIPVIKFPADWDSYNLAAGPIRNKEMANYATHLIAFWDGKSTGTENMIANAKRFNLITKIIYYKK